MPVRRSWPVLLLLLTLAIPPMLGGSQQPPPDALALVGGRIYTSPTADAIDDGVVIVRNGKIAEVGARRSVKIPVGITTINCSGKIITAGFQNSHIHFTEDKWNGAAEQPVSKLNEQLTAMLVRYGFTTVVDTGSLLSNTVALRRRVEVHEAIGPRILTAGVPLYPPNGIPYYVKDGAPPELRNLLPQPSTPTQAAGFVRQNLDGGADIVKLFTGSWITKDTVLPMPAEVATAAVAEAHRHGKLVFTHASNVAGLDGALNAHVDVLAHAIEDTRGCQFECRSCLLDTARMTHTRQIIAMGGGGFSMEPDNLLLDLYILAQASRSHPRVCFVPTASGDSLDYIGRFYTAFRTLDCEPSHLSVFDGPIGDWREYVLSNEVIYVGGGNTRNMLVLWREWKLDAILREAWERGVVLAGISAGSICWFQEGVTDSIPGELSRLECLGFLTGSNCPHYDGEVNRRAAYQRLLKTREIGPGIACDDGVALHYKNDELYRIVSSRSTGRAYRLSLDGDSIQETELIPNYLG